MKKPKNFAAMTTELPPMAAITAPFELLLAIDGHFSCCFGATCARRRVSESAGPLMILFRSGINLDVFSLQRVHRSVKSPSSLKARSSVGEHLLDVEGVGGSIPPVPIQYHLQSEMADPDDGLGE